MTDKEEEICSDNNSFLEGKEKELGKERGLKMWETWAGVYNQNEKRVERERWKIQK